MEACCKEAVAEIYGDGGDDEPSENSGFTCTCGASWTWENGEWKFLQQERRCTVCNHWSCPHCGDYCDQTVDGENGEIDMCPCDGQCTYAEPPPVQQGSSDVH